MPLRWDYFVKTTTILSAASDANDGRDPLGAALTNGIYTNSTRNLDRNGTGNAFTGGTDDVEVGDYIYVTSATGGITVGCYEIESVTDADNVVLVADSGLTADATAVNTSDGPWLTLQFAFDTATAAEAVVICADGGGTGNNWEPTTSVDVDTNGGGSAGNILYQGGTARGIVDRSTKATIAGTLLQTGSVSILDWNASTIGGLSFHDLRFTDTTGVVEGLHAGIASNVDSINLRRCRVDNCNVGIRSNANQAGPGWSLIDCELDNNRSFGMSLNTDGEAGRGVRFLERCSIHDNAGGGIRCSHVSRFVNCLIYGNTDDGISWSRVTTGSHISGCVFFNNSGSGLLVTGSVAGSSIGSVKNCVFRSNGQYAIEWDASFGWPDEIDYCCFSNQGVDTFLNEPSWATIGPNSITSDPLFASEVDGSEDFTPQADSPLINAGIGAPIR